VPASLAALARFGTIGSLAGLQNGFIKDQFHLLDEWLLVGFLFFQILHRACTSWVNLFCKGGCPKMGDSAEVFNRHFRIPILHPSPARTLAAQGEDVAPLARVIAGGLEGQKLRKY
jgi:hypothetical protein